MFGGVCHIFPSSSCLEVEVVDFVMNKAAQSAHHNFSGFVVLHFTIEN